MYNTLLNLLLNLSKYVKFFKWTSAVTWKMRQRNSRVFFPPPNFLNAPPPWSVSLQTSNTRLSRRFSSCSRPSTKATILSKGSLFFHRLYFLHLPFSVCTTHWPNPDTEGVSDGGGGGKFSFERGLSGGCFGAMRVSFAGLLLDRSSATFAIRLQGGNTLIILPALLITGRELTESTCLRVERSFPAALLRQLPFQLNSVLSGCLYGAKRPAGGLRSFYFF